MNLQEFYPGLKLKKALEINTLMTLFHCKFPSGYRFRGERHSFWEFVIVLDGAAGICDGDDIYHLKKGQCFWHSPDRFHSVWSEGEKGLHLGVFSFDGRVELPVTGRIFSVSQAVCRQFTEMRKIAEDVFEFTTEHCGNLIAFLKILPEKDAQAISFVSRMTSLLALCVTTEQPNDHVNNPSAENYLRILNVISQNLHARLSVPEIAAKCNMSVSNAKRIFTGYAGCSISEYYANAKIAEAKRFLSSGTTVAETAERLGFEDPNYFSSFFKRLTGIPPSKWIK